MDFKKELVKELGLGAIAEATMLEDYVKACEAIADRYHQSKLKLLGISIVSGTAEHHCGNQITDKELFYDHCLKCGEYFSED